jgi:hypothetical protein
MKTIAAETSITINASIEKVWQIMLDTAKYPAWNSFVVKAEAAGDPSKPGNKMKLFVKWQKGGGASSNEVIADTQAPTLESDGKKRAFWSYRFVGPLATTGMVQAVRYQWLEETVPGVTLYRTREEFKGLLKLFIPLANVQQGFERQAADLKRHCEK